jgi:acyl-CoA thioesterase I
VLGLRITTQRTFGSMYLVRITLAVAAILAQVSAPPDALASEVQVLTFGDDLVAGVGISDIQAFPARLQTKLRGEGLNVRVIDAGVSGDTTTGALARLDWPLADKPDLAILELGANDALRGIDPKIVRANLDAMVVKIRASGAALLLAGMRAPGNWGAGYQQQFNRIYPDLAQEHQTLLYPFFLEGVAMNPDLNQRDGRHPNARGEAVLVDRIAPYVVSMLTSSSDRNHTSANNRPGPITPAEPAPIPPGAPSPAPLPEQRQIKSGTAFAINGTGDFLTNYHVVKGCSTVRLRVSGEWRDAQTTASDEDNDLAVIRAKGSDTVPPLHFREGKGIRPADQVVAMGFPYAGVLTTNVQVTTGTVSALSGIHNDTRELQLTAPVQPGNSGGPLLDLSSNVVGVVSSKLNALLMAEATGTLPENINFAIKSGIVRGFLEANRIDYDVAQSTEKLDPADVGERAAKSVFMLECQ